MGLKHCCGGVHLRQLGVLLDGQTTTVHLLLLLRVVVWVMMVMDLVMTVDLTAVAVQVVVQIVDALVVVVVVVLVLAVAAVNTTAVAIATVTVAVVHFLFEVQQVFNRVPDAASGAFFASDRRPGAFATGISATATGTLSANTRAAAAAAVLLLLARRRRRRPVATVGLDLQRARRTGWLVTAEPGGVLLGLEPETGDAAGHDVARLGGPVMVH